MKWIVVILVLLNVAVYLLGMKVDPQAPKIAGSSQFETINAAAMSVIQPTQEILQPAAQSVSDSLALEDDELAQLKVDKRGQVLMTPAKSGDAGVANDVNRGKPVAVVTAAPVQADETGQAPVTVAEGRVKKEVLATPAPNPVQLAKIEDPQPPTSPKESTQAALACFRLGPFNDQNSLAAMRRKLENGSIEYTVDESRALRSIKAVRVYMGAFPGTDALEAEKKRLKKMNVEHYVIRLNGTPLVQLGYFSEPARATAYQKTLKSRGIEAKTDTIYHEAKIESWLDVQLASKDAIGSFGLPGNMKAKEKACR